MSRLGPGLAMMLGVTASCGKVDLIPVNAGFTLADVTWFEEEQTLFVFYDVEAEQGIGDPSVVEIRWRTDDGIVEWTPLVDLPAVHRHVEVDCGVNRLCGSWSTAVRLPPRDVRLRLRYHRDGDLALEPPVTFTSIEPGGPSERSLVVYGVFDEQNALVQWRGRHQFPNVRNMRASELGLRRRVRVSDAVYGTAGPELEPGLYGYGADCPADGGPTGLDPVDFDERARFASPPLPAEAFGAPVVCGVAVVEDGLGDYTANAFARKNAETRSAFPVLTTPIQEATRLDFFIAPCERTISQEHEAMQRNRLFVSDEVPSICSEGFGSRAWVEDLVTRFRAAIEAERVNGEDMVLVVGVHRDEAGVASAVEEALAVVVPPERNRSTPHLAGAFVLDSDSRGLTETSIAQSTLWCPSTLPTDDLVTFSARTCPTVPQLPNLQLGPFTAGGLPILPTRDQYLDFVDRYSVGTAGEVTDVTYLAPEFATTTEHIDLGEFGVITFLNGEAVEADPADAFSYCTPEEPLPVYVRSELLDDPAVLEAILEGCEFGEVPEAICQTAELGVLPLEALPIWHSFAQESSYPVGLFWEFPFLLKMEYRTAAAGAISGFGVSVPFGLASPAEDLYGAAQWDADEVRLDPALTQCDRFCDHPTFDPAGVYQVQQTFRDTYPNACYIPDFPDPFDRDSGFPLDP